MNEIKLLILSFFLLFTLGCSENDNAKVIIATPERTEDIVITIVSMDYFKSGARRFNYRLDGYTSYLISAYTSDEKCIDKTKVYIGSRLILPVPIMKNPNESAGTLDPTKDACLLSALTKPLK